MQLNSDLLLQIVIEADTRLSKWIQRLSSDHYLELGDDARLVDDIERDLKSIIRSMNQLEPQFDLSHVPLSRANKYFMTAENLDNVIALVNTIRRNAYGSQQNTRRCISYLEACTESVRDLASYTSLAG